MLGPCRPWRDCPYPGWLIPSDSKSLSCKGIPFMCQLTNPGFFKSSCTLGHSPPAWPPRGGTKYLGQPLCPPSHAYPWKPQWLLPRFSTGSLCLLTGPGASPCGPPVSCGVVWPLLPLISSYRRLAQAYSPGISVFPAAREGRLQCASTFKLLPWSHLLMSYWTEHVTWSSSASKGGKK